MQQGSHHLDIICELENVGTPVEGAALLLEVALAGLLAQLPLVEDGTHLSRSTAMTREIDEMKWKEIYFRGDIVPCPG
jgi:hypothetical protein